MSTTGWIAWDTEEPEEGAVFVWAYDECYAIARACERMGYGLDELARSYSNPRDLVTVVRCKALDGHTEYSLPEEVREAAEDEADEHIRKAAEKKAASDAALAKRIAAAKAKAGGAK